MLSARFWVAAWDAAPPAAEASDGELAMKNAKQKTNETIATSARLLAGSAVDAEELVAAARKRARDAKARLKEARKTLKQAKKLARHARQLAKAAAKKAKDQLSKKKSAKKPAKAKSAKTSSRA